MGGIGSGRPADLGRDTVESCRAIDVNRLHQEGCLHHGWWGGWQWTRDGEKVASINLRAEEDRLHLSYRVRIAGGDWEDVEETVRIVRVPCRFGGTRSYFIAYSPSFSFISSRRRMDSPIFAISPLRCASSCIAAPRLSCSSRPVRRSGDMVEDWS